MYAASAYFKGLHNANPTDVLPSVEEAKTENLELNKLFSKRICNPGVCIVFQHLVTGEEPGSAQIHPGP